MVAQAQATEAPRKETLRERWKRATKPPRRLTFTRAGKFFLLMTLAVGFGALNTGNNLLFLLLGMMLSAIVASGILSEAVLRKLRVHRRPPRRLWAGEGAPASFVVKNPRPYLSLNIEVSELAPECTVGPMVGEAIDPGDIPFWKFWVSDRFGDENYVAIGRSPVLEPNSSTTVKASYVFPERGVYRTGGLRLATRFPFGFFHKVSEVDVPLDLTVFPAPLEAPEWAAEVASRFGDVDRNRAGRGEEYFALRDWREGEDKRRIHWKRSARRGDLVVREFEEREQRAVLITLVTATGRDHESAPRSAEGRFERGLSKLTGLITELTERGFQIGLRAGDTYIHPGRGGQAVDAMLGALARVEMTPGTPHLPPDELDARWARVGVGFEGALAALPGRFDLELTFEKLEEDDLDR